MDLQGFKSSLSEQHPANGMSLALQALWWDAKDDWEKAHECAQARDDQPGMRVHAYLHRKEGDQWNAGYWYRRCRTEPSAVSLEEEWEELVQLFLGQA